MDGKAAWRRRAALIEEALRSLKKELLTKTRPLTFDEWRKVEEIDALLAERG